MPDLHKQIIQDTDKYTDDDDKLTALLGGEYDDSKVLLKRGEYLSILLDKFHEICNTMSQSEHEDEVD